MNNISNIKAQYIILCTQIGPIHFWRGNGKSAVCQQFSKVNNKLTEEGITNSDQIFNASFE